MRLVQRAARGDEPCYCANVRAIIGHIGLLHMTEPKAASGPSKALAMGDPNMMDASRLAEFIAAVIEDGMSGALSVEQATALEKTAGKRLQQISLQLFELGRHQGSSH